MGAEKRWFIDSADIWESFGMFVMGGTDQLLRTPQRKEPLSYEWQDANGTDVDLSRVFFKSREITLKIGFRSEGYDDFWLKYASFLSLISKPYRRRLEIAEFQRSYYVYYKDCLNFERLQAINTPTVIRFDLVLIEPEPTIENNIQFIIDEDGRFIVT